MKGASGKGNWDQPRHTTCGGLPLWEYPAYSDFWSVFGATCPRMQRLASWMGLGTTARLAPRQGRMMGLPDYRLWTTELEERGQSRDCAVSPKTGVTCCKHGRSGSSDRFCAPIKGERKNGDVIRPWRWPGFSPRGKPPFDNPRTPDLDCRQERHAI